MTEQELIDKQKDVVQTQFLHWEQKYYSSIKAYQKYTEELMLLQKLIEQQNSNQLKLTV